MKQTLLSQILPLISISFLAAEPAIEAVEISDKLPDPSSIRFTPPQPPKQVPPLQVKGSTTADFGTHRIAILRGEPSNLPDIPGPQAAAPPVAPPAKIADSGFHLSIGGTVYDGNLSKLNVWNPKTRTHHSAWCGWDVSLLAPFHQITVGGKIGSLMLPVWHVNTVGSQRPGKSTEIPAHPQVEPGAIVVPDGDEFTSDILIALRDHYQKNLTRLKEIREAQDQQRRDAAAWHAANPTQPQDHTIWLKPHRGSRYLSTESNVTGEEGQ
jgi:hypothetical protein